MEALKNTNRSISIHAPRGGSDFFLFYTQQSSYDFNPRSPWGERPVLIVGRRVFFQFQSTLPVGGATPCGVLSRYMIPISIHAPRGGSDRLTRDPEIRRTDFNPRSPWGERHEPPTLSDGWIRISIHAPRGGSDPAPRFCACPCKISIHAPRGGSDLFPPQNSACAFYFNPRSPWGERPMFSSFVIRSRRFQSTLPVGGATGPSGGAGGSGKISIHAPRGGSDQCVPRFGRDLRNFNPRSPWGERLIQ